jgi:hypothetical protein
MTVRRLLKHLAILYCSATQAACATYYTKTVRGDPSLSPVATAN